MTVVKWNRGPLFAMNEDAGNATDDGSNGCSDHRDAKTRTKAEKDKDKRGHGPCSPYFRAGYNQSDANAYWNVRTYCSPLEPQSLPADAPVQSVDRSVVEGEQRAVPNDVEPFFADGGNLPDGRGIREGDANAVPDLLGSYRCRSACQRQRDDR